MDRKKAYKTASKIRSQINEIRNNGYSNIEDFNKIQSSYNKAKDKSVGLMDFLEELRDTFGSQGRGKGINKYGKINSKGDFLNHFITREGNLKNLRKALTTGSTTYSIDLGKIPIDVFSTNSLFVHSFVVQSIKQIHPSINQTFLDYLHVKSIDMIGLTPKDIKEEVRYCEDYNVFTNYDVKKSQINIADLVSNGDVQTFLMADVQYTSIKIGKKVFIKKDNYDDDWDSSQYVKKQNGEITFLYAKGKDNYVRTKDEFTGNAHLHVKPTEFMQTDAFFTNFTTTSFIVTFEIPNKILYDSKFSLTSGDVKNVGIPDIDNNWLTLDTFFNIEIVVPAYPLVFSSRIKSNLNQFQTTLPLVHLIFRISKTIRSITKLLQPYNTATKKLNISTIKKLISEIFTLQGIFKGPGSVNLVKEMYGELKQLIIILESIMLGESHFINILKWLENTDNLMKLIDALDATVQSFIIKGHGTLNSSLIGVLTELLYLFTRYENYDVNGIRVAAQLQELDRTVSDMIIDYEERKQNDMEMDGANQNKILINDVNNLLLKVYDTHEEATKEIEKLTAKIKSNSLSNGERLIACLEGSLLKAALNMLIEQTAAWASNFGSNIKIDDTNKKGKLLSLNQENVRGLDVGLKQLETLLTNALKQHQLLFREDQKTINDFRLSGNWINVHNQIVKYGVEPFATLAFGTLESIQKLDEEMHTKRREAEIKEGKDAVNRIIEENARLENQVKEAKANTPKATEPKDVVIGYGVEKNPTKIGHVYELIDKMPDFVPEEEGEEDSRMIYIDGTAYWGKKAAKQHVSEMLAKLLEAYNK